MHEIFKGLLFLHGYVNAADLAGESRKSGFGARRAGDAFARPSGHRVAPRRWSGAPTPDAREAPCRGACA